MEEGKVPSSNSTQKDFMNLGESWKGGETLVPILGDPSQKAFGTTLRVGSKGDFCPFPSCVTPSRLYEESPLLIEEVN